MLGAAVAFSTAHFFYSNQLLAGADTGTSLGEVGLVPAPRHTGRHHSTLRMRSDEPPSSITMVQAAAEIRYLDLDRRLSARVPMRLGWYVANRNRVLCQNGVRYPRKRRSNTVIYGDTQMHTGVAESRWWELEVMTEVPPELVRVKPFSDKNP
jgi:hypothetical protein